MPTPRWREVAPDCFQIADGGNVYVLRDQGDGIAVDYGSGGWRQRLADIGVCRLRHVVVTHAHRDQVCGLYRGADPGAVVHVPAGDAALVTASALDAFWTAYQDGGCPSCYAAPRLPLPAARADMIADGETLVGPARFCAVPTPGHTQGALSYAVTWRGRQLVFCGDAVHAGGTVHQPYHLEWDHWTASGCLAAWAGLERLRGCPCQVLLPAHGPTVATHPRACIERAQRRLLALARAKGSVCAGARQQWVDMEPLASGARRVLPHLFQFGANSYLLVGRGQEGLVIDPQLPDLHALEPLLAEAGVRRVTVGTASHYHCDHSDGLNALRERYQAATWLHPRVADPLRDRNRWEVPWLPRQSVQIDRLLPAEGSFRWGGYQLASHDYPGQTRWHTAIDGRIDGCRVLFSGDNYQPPTRWNGTGGFCAYNGSRFDAEGFIRSAGLALRIAPDMVCNGHGCVYWFRPDHYRRILRWAPRAQRAVTALCPEGDLAAHYAPRRVRWEPFVSCALPGDTVHLELLLAEPRATARRTSVAALAPPGWTVTPAAAGGRVRDPGTTAWRCAVAIPQRTPAGRYLVAADVERDGQLLAEAAVALVDVRQAPAGRGPTRATRGAR